MNKQLITIFFISFFSTFCKSQTQLFDNSKVDSLTFVKTRSIINELPNSAFEKHIYKLGNKELPFRLLLPKNYDKSKKYPLILTFHNSSRIGNDNEKQLEHLSKIWIRDDIYNQNHAFVIAPQFNERSSIYEKNENGVLISTPYNEIQLILELLNNFEKIHKVDEKRIYLVGYSMGASTVQNLMNLFPNKFAAIVSVAAVPDFSNIKRLKHKNIFLIHGKNDLDNPYNGSLELFTKLKGNKNLIFKTFNELNHNNITIPLLLSDEIPNWLFKQKK